MPSGWGGEKPRFESSDWRALCGVANVPTVGAFAMRRDETKAVVAPLPLTRGGALDALRFLAAFLMVIHHYAAEAPVPLAKIHPVFERGYLATDFFLIVSGYVLGRIYGDRVADGRMSAGAFLLRRAGRVVPAHVMICVTFIILVLATGWVGIKPLHPQWFDWSELPSQAALVQSWGIFPGGRGWNAPTWSLSALLVCYFAFPRLWRGLRRVKNAALALTIGIAGLAMADLLTQRFLGYPVYEMPLHWGVIRAAPLFLLGVTLALCAERIYIPAAAARIFGLASLLLLGLLQAIGRFDFMSLALIALIILAAGAVPTKKRSYVLERGALVSFALFITNELVRVVYFGVDHALDARFGFSQNLEWAIWYGGPVAAVIFAIAFHYIIDWPSQGWIKRKLGEEPGPIARLWSLLPRPDPTFDPAAGRGRSPRVREVMLHHGPTPGVVRDPSVLATTPGVTWG